MFVYLARDASLTGDEMETGYAYIGISRLPFHRVEKQHNRESGWKTGAKATKQASPYWIVELVIGPFVNGGAEEFKQNWRRKSRRFSRRVKEGVAMAHLQNLTVYCRDIGFIKQLTT